MERARGEAARLAAPCSAHADPARRRARADGQEVLNIWYDYAGLFASGVILSLAVLWKRRTVAQVAQIDAYNARIGTYALLTVRGPAGGGVGGGDRGGDSPRSCHPPAQGIASSVVPIHTLSMHPHGMRDYYMVKTGDDATYMMLSKKGKHYDKARLLDVLNGRPSAPSGHSREEEEKRAAEPLQRLGRGPGKRK